MKIIIEFEGLDCHLKETNTKALFDKLKDLKEDRYRDAKIVLSEFPQYLSGSSFFIKQFLSGKYDDEDTGEKFSMLSCIESFYELDYFHTFKTTLEPIFKESEKLHRDSILILDRYSYSNIIYNDMDRYDREKLPDILRSDMYRNYLEAQYGLPKANIVVFLTMKFETMMDLIANKKEKDKNEINAKYLAKVYDNYMLLLDNIGIKPIYNQGKIQTEFIVINLEHSNGILKSRNELADEIFNKVKVLTDMIMANPENYTVTGEISDYVLQY